MIKPLSSADYSLINAARLALEVATAHVGIEAAADALQIAMTLARRQYKQQNLDRYNKSKG